MAAVAKSENSEVRTKVCMGLPFVFAGIQSSPPPWDHYFRRLEEDAGGR